MNGRTAVPARRDQGAVVGNQQRLEEIRHAMLGRVDDVTAALAGLIPAEKFIEVAITAIATIKDSELRAKVLACTTDSLVVAVVQAAQAGLKIDQQQSTIIPYGPVATWTPMVKGRRDLLQRIPGVTGVVTGHVMEGDEFEFWRDEHGDHIKHTPRFGGKKLLAAYAIVRYSDARVPAIVVLPVERIDQIQATMSKAPNGPAWKNSKPYMGEKCALNRLTQTIDTDVEMSQRLRAAMEAEFEIEHDEETNVERAAARIGQQVDDLRTRVENASTARAEAEKTMNEIRVTNEAAQANLELRGVLLEKIRAAVNAHALSRDEAAVEAAAALVMAKHEVYAKRDDGSPDLNALTAEQMKAILEHLEQLGPGFASEGEKSAGNAEDAGGAADGPADAADASDADGKVDPLVCRRVHTGRAIHVGDPRDKTLRCLGCGIKMTDATGAKPSADPTDYCVKALNLIERDYDAERIPDPMLEALRGDR